MALTLTRQHVAHALDYQVKVYRDSADNSTVQTLVLLDSTGAPVNFAAIGIVSGTLTYTASRPSIADGVSTEALAADAATKYAEFTNNNDFPFFLAFGATLAIMNQGIKLDPGASKVFNTVQAINAIQNSGGALNLDVLKGV